jgi:hypothetical protein
VALARVFRLAEKKRGVEEGPIAACAGRVVAMPFVVVEEAAILHEY